MSKNNKKKAAQVETKPAEPKQESQLVSSIILIYFVAAFGFTAFATDHQMFTYGQISFIYLPMFFIFIYWQYGRIQETRANGGHTKLGNIIAIGLCIFIIIATICITIGSWTGMLTTS